MRNIRQEIHCFEKKIPGLRVYDVGIHLLCLMSERVRSALFIVLGEAHICTHVEEEEEKRRRKKASPPLGTRLLKEDEEGLLSVGVRSKGFFPFSSSSAQPRKRPSHFPLSLVSPLCPKTVTQVQERRRDVRRRRGRAVPHLAPLTTTVNSPRNFAAGKTM